MAPFLQKSKTFLS